MSDKPPERNRNILIGVNKLNKTFATKSGPVDVLFR